MNECIWKTILLLIFSSVSLLGQENKATCWTYTLSNDGMMKEMELFKQMLEFSDIEYTKEQLDSFLSEELSSNNNRSIDLYLINDTLWKKVNHSPYDSGAVYMITDEYNYAYSTIDRNYIFDSTFIDKKEFMYPYIIEVNQSNKSDTTIYGYVGKATKIIRSSKYEDEPKKEIEVISTNDLEIPLHALTNIGFLMKTTMPAKVSITERMRN